MAKHNGIAVFGALWMCMSTYYIQAQALTLAKSYDEHLGLLKEVVKSLKMHGYEEPSDTFSDDPVKV